MIDWSKEKTEKGNYCGYCTGYPPSANCDGSCFNDKAKNCTQNRVEHCLDMLKSIPEQIEELKKKEQDYKDALSA